MAEIMEKIGKALQEHAIPAAKRYQGIISNVMGSHYEQAKEMPR